MHRDSTSQHHSGETLQHIRRRQGIALRTIASTTRIRLAYLRHIEADNFADLPPLVFVVGYLEHYARCLGLDPAPITRAYRERFNAWEAARSMTAARLAS